MTEPIANGKPEQLQLAKPNLDSPGLKAQSVLDSDYDFCHPPRMRRPKGRHKLKAQEIIVNPGPLPRAECAV